MELQCAWCHSNKRAHNHTTYECRLFRNANNQQRKWKVVQQYNVCTACLSLDHTTAKCTHRDAAQCHQCNSVHDQFLGCKPTNDSISEHALHSGYARARTSSPMSSVSPPSPIKSQTYTSSNHPSKPNYSTTLHKSSASSLNQ